MPFNELHRRDSWPPTVLRLRDEESENAVDEIDENPFLFFLTAPEDVDDLLDDEALDAGIETPNYSSPVRAVSPSSLQRVPLEEVKDVDDKDYSFGIAMPLTLKDFTLHHTSGRKSRAGKRSDDYLTGLGIIIPESSSTRGRAKVRLTPSRVGRGRGQTRSLSARRPQSWRQPSPDMWSIKEERESDDGDEQTDRKVETTEDLGLSSSAPPTLHLEQNVTFKSKAKKRVHWVF